MSTNVREQAILQLGDAQEISDVIEGLSSIVKKSAINSIDLDKNQIYALVFAIEGACKILSEKIDLAEISVRASLSNAA